MAYIYTIRSNPKFNKSGVDKIGRCAVFVNCAGYQLPFSVEPEPTEAMLRNGCYGIETDEEGVLEYFRELDWERFSRLSTNGARSTNMRFLKRALEEAGIRVEEGPRTQRKSRNSRTTSTDDPSLF